MTVLRCVAKPRRRLSVDESTESTQRFQRESRNLHKGQGGRARLRHPSWKQSPGTVELIDDEIIAVTLAPVQHHSQPFPHARMVRVVDQNLGTLFLGSMT